MVLKIQVKLATMLLAGAAHLTIYTCFLAEAAVFSANNAANGTDVDSNIVMSHGG